MSLSTVQDSARMAEVVKQYRAQAIHFKSALFFKFTRRGIGAFSSIALL